MCSEDLYRDYVAAHYGAWHNFSEAEYRRGIPIYDAILGRFLPRNPDARILDVGCGCGRLLYYIQSRGYVNHLGIDVSDELVDLCNNHATVHVRQVDAFDYLESQRGQWDCITATHVLEHIAKGQIEQMLSLMHQALAPGGRLIVTVPNAANPFGLVLRYDDFTHSIAFTEHSLRAVLHRAGFREIQLARPRPVRTWTGIGGYLARQPIFWGLKLAYLVQGYSVPKILDQLLIGVGDK